MDNQAFLDWLHANSDYINLLGYRRTPLIMGILNVTPDSFSDGGAYQQVDAAYDRALMMIEQGADLIDIGGESSRPGACLVSVDEELSRVIPVIKRIRVSESICISVDTSKPAVMRAAVDAGANVINDIQALRAEGAVSTVAALGVPVCLMHMQGKPRTMQTAPQYPNGLVETIDAFFDERIRVCLDAGILHKQLMLDPGFGFGKTVLDNLRLIKQVAAFHKYGLPLLLGVSRKSTLAAVVGDKMAARLSAGLALTVFAAAEGVTMIRTHDVFETKHALCMLNALYEENDRG